MKLGSSGYAVLETDYALVFLNVGNEERPKRRYDFSSWESGYESFDNLEGLAKRLERIPPPRIVDFYSTCGAPPWYGLPQEDIDAFFQRMRDLGVDLRRERPNGNSNFICTCP